MVLHSLKEKLTTWYQFTARNMLVASKYFIYAGKLITHSVIHAGFGLAGLSKAIVEYIINEDDMQSCLTFLSVEDIPDHDIQNIIREVMYYLLKHHLSDLVPVLVSHC